MEEKSIKYELLAIGGSAGGLEVVIDIIPFFPADFSLAILIILHRRDSESVLVDLLAEKAILPVKEVEEKEPVLPGHIYIAPGDYHVLIEADKTFSLDFSEKVNYSRPSIDVSFESAAEVYTDTLIGLLLSGANADGTEGFKAIKKSGGLTIVQNPTNAAVAYMPQQAVESLSVDKILTTEEIIQLIRDLK
jgi:two-component system, chemotaxis family, protein-glutamate methylesterase/glutaminase